ncbi:hypothetical protein [Desulfuromonas sp. TF]|uniref:hypothetical protein n=1 Tax=Desulfuromonas sp. TF TaxID=1232410 RepID=UPI0004149E8B|nr:hypothetical protein [Desulfuromonas sp. TF]
MNRNCEFCGRELPEAKKTGRPRAFCGDNCRKLVYLLGKIEDRLVLVNPTPEKKKLLRRRLWSAANIMN